MAFYNLVYFIKVQERGTSTGNVKVYDPIKFSKHKSLERVQRVCKLPDYFLKAQERPGSAFHAKRGTSMALAPARLAEFVPAGGGVEGGVPRILNFTDEVDGGV